jgi:hypothetical protein
MGQMFNKTCDQRNNWRWDYPHACGDQVDCYNLQTSHLGQVLRTIEHFSWYGSNDLSAKIQPPSSWKYKPGNFLAVVPLNWDEKINEDNDDENWVDLRAPSG